MMNHAPSDPESGNPPSSLDRIDEVCQGFESAWQSGLPPRIEDFVGPHAVTDPAAPDHDLLVELVLMDLEYRWRAAATERPSPVPAGDEPAFPQRPRLEDYVARFPALGPLEQLPDDLIGDEYRIRHAASWGDHPAVAEYVERFGHDRPQLAEVLRAIERELATPRPSPVADANDSASLAGAGPGVTLRYFGDYELLEEIGRGGMGVVFRARQVSLNRIVAVKMILAAWLAEDKAVQRFHAEAESAAKLDHAGIVPVYEVGQHEGQHYFSMGYVDGRSLAKRLAQQGPLAPREAAEMVRKVAEAMHYAHGQGVVHRFRAKLPDSCKLVCDRWMHDHPADMEAVRWAMRLALKEQHYVRVLELFQGLPADAPQPADFESLADAARTKLREAAAKLPQEPAAKEAKPTARDAPARL